MLFFVCISGCGIYEKHGYGELAISKRIDGVPATPVNLPANAPSITQRYRPAGIASSQGGHNGIDLFVPVGTPVLAAAEGVISTVQLSVLYGNQVFIDHGEDAQGRKLQTRYFHLDVSMVSKKQTVSRGEQIGRSGVTGVYAVFPHLHFEVHTLYHVGEIPSHKAVDPQLHWVDGSGNITCFDAHRAWTDKPVLLTYPAPCKGVDWR